MSEFKNKLITTKGLELLSSALAGGKLEFTRIVMGSGTPSEDVGNIEALATLQQDLPIAKIIRKGSQVTLSATLTNEEIKSEYDWTEIGVYAKGADETEVLYMYGYTENSSFISKDSLNEKLINITVMVSNVSEVTAVINSSLVYLTLESLEDHNNDEKAHPSIKEWVNKLVGGIKLTWDGITGKPDTFPPSKHGHTASEVGALPIEGGELSGDLSVGMRVNSNGLKGTNKQLICGTDIVVYVGNPDTQMNIECNNTPNLYINGSVYSMYHSGNKPTASDIGASPNNHEHDFGYFKTVRGTVSDFDYALKEGQYDLGGENIPHAPKSGLIWGVLLVYVSDGGTHNNSNNWIWQQAYLTDGTDWQRHKTNSGAWTSWSRIHPKSPADIGAVSTYGGNISGKLHLDSARGNNAEPTITLALGDNDSGFDFGGDGVVNYYANDRLMYSMNDVATKAYVDSRSVSPIKSIQRGTAGGGDGVTVKISAVNLSKSFVIGGSTEYVNGTDLNPHSLARLVDATTIQFVGHSLGTQVWQVIEFN